MDSGNFQKLLLTVIICRQFFIKQRLDGNKKVDHYSALLDDAFAKIKKQKNKYQFTV